MQTICLHDKFEIGAFLRRDIFLNIYSLGDLDDFFWPYTTWYGLKGDGDLQAVVLLYTAMNPPVLLALTLPETIAPMQRLLNSILALLPRKVYTHLSPGLENALEQAYRLESYGKHYKMALKDASQIGGHISTRVVHLSQENLSELIALYEASNPEVAFDPRTLDTRQYFGIRENGRLVSAAGIHVYSPSQQVAALGNIATHPSYRNKGFGTAVTATLCRNLLKSVKHIGLNVKADNHPAIHSYQKLGFEITSLYHEIMAIPKT